MFIDLLVDSLLGHDSSDWEPQADLESDQSLSLFISEADFEQTYGISVVFSRTHMLQLRCRPRHKQPQRYRNIHSLLRCHKHTSLARKLHNMELDPPLGQNVKHKVNKPNEHATKYTYFNIPDLFLL